MTDARPFPLSAWPSFAAMCRDIIDETPDDQDALLRAWMRHDVAAFALTCLPSRFRAKFNRMHLDWMGYDKRPFNGRKRDTLYAIAAPRGSAKSTLITFADLLHDLCFGLEAFVGTVSYTSDLSDELASDLYHTLKIPETAPELHRMFGPFAVSGTKTSFVAHTPHGRPNGMKIKAFSMRSTVRGQKHDGTRFTKFVLDDAEHPERVRRPENRDSDEKHIESDIMRAGEPGLITIMVGTILVNDSVLQRKLDPNSGGSWEQRHYRSLLRKPHEFNGLWEQARRVWADLSHGGAIARRAALDAFYEEHREALERGAVVLWPDRRPLVDLMVSYWENPRAFFAEDQNEPQESTEITFNVDGFQYVSFDGERIIRDDGSSVPLSACNVRGWWDPIPFGAKNTGRDEAGWAVVARCPNGGRYILHASGCRATPEEQWEITFRLMEQFPGSRWGYENNTGSLDDNPDWRRELARRGLSGMIRGFKTAGARKMDRIAEIQPSTNNGFIRFSRTDIAPAAFAQFRAFPFGRHDDIIDAIERACNMATTPERERVHVSNPARPTTTRTNLHRGRR